MFRLCFILLALALTLPVLGAPTASPSRKPAAKPSGSPLPIYPKITTESGLIYRDIVVGQGEPPQPGQVLVIHYVGRLQGGGRVFDSSFSRGAPFEFTLGKGEVIPGMEEGISTMRVGGRRRIVVPPSLGYRDNIVGTIPPDSTLEFEVMLLGIK